MEEEKYENIDRETHVVVGIIKGSLTHVTDNKFLSMLTDISLAKTNNGSRCLIYIKSG